MHRKIKNKEKHVKRFIQLTIVFFGLEFLLLLKLLFSGEGISIGEILVPSSVTHMMMFISVAMIYMGVYYLRNE